MDIGRQALIGAALAWATMGAAPALADVKSGVEAWQQGQFAAAIKEWRPLAEQGDADAQFNLGQAYRLGRGVPADLRVAQSWFGKAAAKGHEQAQGNLGLILYEGGKRREALPWIRMAADRGDPRAQYVLGIELTNGDLVAKDWPRAYGLMTRAAGQGLPAAARSLTKMEQFMPADQRRQGIALARQIERPAKPVAAGKATMAAPAPNPAGGAGAGWRVQLGAYGSPAAAQAQWTAIRVKVPALGALRPSYEKAGTLTRLRAGPLGSRAAVNKLCGVAKAAGQPCYPIAP
jgi:hypothetical protein